MKICSGCKASKPLTEFNTHTGKKDGYQSQCKDCNKKTAKEYYERNKVAHKATINKRNKENRARMLKQMLDYLDIHPCIDCKETDPVVLEFDHQRDKTYNISGMMRDGRPWISVLKEIEKCEVVCSNCHKRRTAKQFKWYKLRA